MTIRAPANAANCEHLTCPCWDALAMAAPPHASLRTPRLLLRPIQADDAPAIYAACQDPQIQRWTSVPSPYLADHAQQFAVDYAPQAWASGAAAIFAVTDRADGQLLASVGLHFDRGRDEGIAEIGYWAAAHCRGRGVTTEAVTAVCQWGLTSGGVQRLEWYAEVGNIASRRVAEKVGFVVEGTLRQFLVHGDGERVDAWVASLLRADVLPTPAAVG
jgi:RimJ/RimL family protein N-acetyltransferase